MTLSRPITFLTSAAAIPLTALAAAACGGGAATAAQSPAPTKTTNAGTATVRVADRAFSANQLAGERVIYSYQGLTPPATLVAQIKAGRAAGVIFYRDNIASEAQIKHVIVQLQTDAAASPVKLPLLLLTDQEGGQVRRLRGSPSLCEKQIGQSANPALAATHAGRCAGLNLKSVGINVNLAPVLDVYRSSGNFIDRYGRSYSSNPQKVAQLGTGFIKAQQQTGVAATAKHFPGLGAATTHQNTDTGPVTLNVPLTRLRSTDELPYRSAISAHVKLVLLSWAIYPALDAHHPAGLSSTIVQNELRERLRFKGVTISDALEAGALRAYGSTSNRAVLAARAGIDLLLCASQSVAQGTTAVNAVADALNTGKLNKVNFTASANRIIALRESLAPRRPSLAGAVPAS